MSKLLQWLRKWSLRAHHSPGQISAQGKLILVTGVGHCGTKWLSTVLHQPRYGMICYHEYKNKMTHGNWYDTLRYEFEHGVDRHFDPYFQFLVNQRSKYKIVTDSGSWTPARIPEVDERLRIDLVIHLVRNGIQNVHSMFYGHINRSRSDWLYTHYLRWYWELADCPGGDWGTYTDWGYWCFAWTSHNLTMPSWLASKLGSDRVVVYQLEELVGDVNKLLEMLQKVNPQSIPRVRELMKLQKKDVNRKVQGDRSPEALWAKWTDEQRQVFIRICGPTMERYGYEIPPRP